MISCAVALPRGGGVRFDKASRDTNRTSGLLSFGGRHDQCCLYGPLIVTVQYFFSGLNFSPCFALPAMPPLAVVGVPSGPSPFLLMVSRPFRRC
jgi:hypothetical protein